MGEYMWCVYYPNDPEDYDFHFCDDRTAAREALDIRMSTDPYHIDGVGILHIYEDSDGETYEIEDPITDLNELREIAGDKKLRRYRIKPECLDLWGSDADSNTIVTEDDIEMVSRGWGMSIDEVLRQLDEIYDY